MKESLIYLEVLKYIKKNGVEDFQYFIKSAVIISMFIKMDLSPSKITELYSRLEEKKVKALDFIDSLDLSIRQKALFLNPQFAGIICQLTENIDKIDLYIENAQKLADLGIDKIDIVNLSSQFDYRVTGHVSYKDISNISVYFTHNNDFVYYKDGNIEFCNHLYTDGIFKVTMVSGITGKGTLEEPYITERNDGLELYEVVVKGATFLIEVENTQHYKNMKRIAITDFGFDSIELPETLENQFEPEYAHQYKKTLQLKR